MKISVYTNKKGEKKCYIQNPLPQLDTILRDLDLPKKYQFDDNLRTILLDYPHEFTINIKRW